jgi:hypothetical protein
MNLSNNLRLTEATRSETAKRLGISNQPTPEHLENLKAIAVEIFEPCREFVGGPLAVSSGYRSKALNAAIKGSSTTSDHLKGQALDLDCDIHGNGTNRELFYYILENLDFGQLIWEYGGDPINANASPDWVHVSYYTNKPNKKQVLRATRKSGRVTYQPFYL